MTTYVLNSLPNEILPEEGTSLLMHGINLMEVYRFICESESGSCRLRKGVVTLLDHVDFSQLLSVKLSFACYEWSDKPVIGPYIGVRRDSCKPIAGDTIIAMLAISPSRVDRRDRWDNLNIYRSSWTDEELLNMRVRWIRIDY